MILVANVILVIILIFLLTVVISLNHRMFELEGILEQMKKPLIALLQEHKINFPWELYDDD